jgi:hypothetical protein
MTYPILPNNQPPQLPPPPPPPKPKAEEKPEPKPSVSTGALKDEATAMRQSGAKSKLSLQPPAPVVVAPWTPPDEAPAATLYRELGQAADGPGEMFNMMSKKHLEDVRGDYEDLDDDATKVKGVIYEMEDTDDGPRARVKGFEDIPAPNGDQWDPKQFAPHYVFDGQEDAFPIRPDYDGNGDTGDNGGSELEDTGSDHYRDGVIDDKQALNAGFVVQQKGEYTVLTYSNYYATNKGAHYHKNDYSTAQVYLKPNEKGEMEPQFLATSWHYGTQLTPWKDVKKDASGHPVIGVGLGTHSLQPYGTKDEVPKDGLHLNGDGTTTLNGKPTAQQLTYDAFQSNVKNATILDDPESDRATARRTTLGYGWAAADPLLPSTFNDDNTLDQVEDRIEGDLDAVEEHGGDSEDAAKEAILDNFEKVKHSGEDVPEKSTLDKLKDFLGF